MNTLRTIATLGVLLAAVSLAAQNPTPVNPIEATTVAFKLRNGPQPATGLSIQQTGAPGPSSLTYYYWVVAKSLMGNAQPAGPLGAFNANPTLSVSNFFTIFWQPVANASGYDVLRTTTPTMPSGACACAVVLNTASLNVNDQSNALLGYTVATFDSITAQTYIANDPISAGVNHLLLYNYQNQVIGDFQADVFAFNGRTGFVLPAIGDYTCTMITGGACLNSPAFTGLPTAPTQPPLTNNTTIATTAYADASAGVAAAAAALLVRGIQASSITLLGAPVAIAVSPNPVTPVLTHAVTMPASGCPCRAYVSYQVNADTTAAGTLAMVVNDGTNDFATGATSTPGSATEFSVQGTSASTGTYANSAPITFTLNAVQNMGAGVANAHVSNSLLGQSSYLNIVIFTSN